MISSAVENAGKDQLYAFEHQGKKFPPLQDKPDMSRMNMDVPEHPLDMGLAVDDHSMDDGRPSGRVADALPGSFAAKMSIEEGDEIIGIESSDIEH